MLHLTGQLTGKLVKVDILPVYHWSSKSSQFSALEITIEPMREENQKDSSSLIGHTGYLYAEGKVTL